MTALCLSSERTGSSAYALGWARDPRSSLWCSARLTGRASASCPEVAMFPIRDSSPPKPAHLAWPAVLGPVDLTSIELPRRRGLLDNAWPLRRILTQGAQKTTSGQLTARAKTLSCQRAWPHVLCCFELGAEATHTARISAAREAVYCMPP